MAVKDTSILDNLYTQQLPTLPAGAPSLLRSLSDENVDFNELVEIIGRFPNITARLMSLANSAWSAPVTAVTSLEVACSRLGFTIVKSTSIALTVATPFNSNKCPAFDAEYFWTMALMCSDAASSLVTVSGSLKDVLPASARTAGLLHNLGLLWLVDKLPEDVGRAIENSKANEQTLRQSLVDIIGLDHAQAGERLGQYWELPEMLVTAMGHYPEVDYQGDYHEVVQVTGLAVELVTALYQGSSCPHPGPRSTRLGLNEQDLNQVFEQLSLKLVRVRDLANLLFSD